MALSFFQKLKMGFRGWSRRREQAAEQRDREFVAKSTSWVAPAVVDASAAVPKRAATAIFDLEGLEVAFLDDSGQMAHYLDVETGEVIEFLSQDSAQHPEISTDRARYRRVPTRDAKSDAEDRQTFPGTLEPSAVREALSRVPASDAAAFRRAIAADRAVERRWYSFKNDRASEAIQRWLSEVEKVDG